MINFEQYHNENPHIWEAFVRFAKEAKQRGFKKYSANGIFELIRWEMKAKSVLMDSKSTTITELITLEK